MITKNNVIKIFLISLALIGIFVAIAPLKALAATGCPSGFFLCEGECTSVPCPLICEGGYYPSGGQCEACPVPSSAGICENGMWCTYSFSGWESPGVNCNSSYEVICTNETANEHQCWPTATSTRPNPIVRRFVSIDPFTQSIEIGDTGSFSATFTMVFRDGTSDEYDVTSQATWSSSDESIATSLGAGIFRGLARGQVTVTATYRSIRSASARLTVTPIVFNLAAIGECHQNYPTPSVQSYISWNSVAGATSYKVYWNQSIFIPGGTLIANTTNLSYIHGNLSFDSSYRYYAEAINAGGNVIVQSLDAVATTPASCALPPPPPPPPPPGGGETLVITPSEKTINQGSTDTFDALYDPDGGSGARYGQWLANTFAGWSSQNSSIAQSLGNGSFSGVAPGSSLVYAWLPNTAPRRTSARIAASATLNVQSVAAPDFTLTAAPPLQTVEKPSSTSYTVSIASLNGFGGVVALSVLNPPAGVTPSFDPATVTAAGNATLALAVAAGAPDGISTVTVLGTSGAISHSAPVDIIITSPPAALSCSVTANPTSGNAPLTVTATANGANGTAPYQYRFDWESDGTFDTAYGGNSAQTVYNSAGLYRITAAVQDATSATATCTTQSTGSDVTVNPPGLAQVDLKARPRGSGGPWHDNLSAGAAMTVPYDYAFNVAQVELSWNSQNVSSCTGSWVGGQEVETSRAQNNPIVVDLAVPATVGETATHNLTITCNPTDTVTIEVTKAAAPNCSLTASDNTIIWGQPVTLEWRCSDPSSVSDLKLVDGADKDIVNPADPDGGQTKQKPKTTTSYFLKWKEGVAGVDVEVKVDVSVGFLPVLREIIPRW